MFEKSDKSLRIRRTRRKCWTRTRNGTFTWKGCRLLMWGFLSCLVNSLLLSFWHRDTLDEFLQNSFLKASRVSFFFCYAHRNSLEVSLKLSNAVIGRLFNRTSMKPTRESPSRVTNEKGWQYPPLFKGSRDHEESLKESSIEATRMRVKDKDKDWVCSDKIYLKTLHVTRVLKMFQHLNPCSSFLDSLKTQVGKGQNRSMTTIKRSTILEHLESMPHGWQWDSLYVILDGSRCTRQVLVIIDNAEQAEWSENNSCPMHTPEMHFSPRRTNPLLSVKYYKEHHLGLEF